MAVAEWGLESLRIIALMLAWKLLRMLKELTSKGQFLIYTIKQSSYGKQNLLASATSLADNRLPELRKQPEDHKVNNCFLATFRAGSYPVDAFHLPTQWATSIAAIVNGKLRCALVQSLLV